MVINRTTVDEPCIEVVLLLLKKKLIDAHQAGSSSSCKVKNSRSFRTRKVEFDKCQNGNLAPGACLATYGNTGLMYYVHFSTLVEDQSYKVSTYACCNLYQSTWGRIHLYIFKKQRTQFFLYRSVLTLYSFILAESSQGV